MNPNTMALKMAQSALSVAAQQAMNARGASGGDTSPPQGGTIHASNHQSRRLKGGVLERGVAFLPPVVATFPNQMSHNDMLAVAEILAKDELVVEEENGKQKGASNMAAYELSPDGEQVTITLDVPDNCKHAISGMQDMLKQGAAPSVSGFKPAETMAAATPAGTAGPPLPSSMTCGEYRDEMLGEGLMVCIEETPKGPDALGFIMNTGTDTLCKAMVEVVFRPVGGEPEVVATTQFNGFLRTNEAADFVIPVKKLQKGKTCSLCHIVWW